MYGYGMGYGYRYGYYGFDWTVILVLIGVVLSLWAQSRVTSTFNKYSKVRSRTGMTGAEAARRLLASQGIYDVTVQPVSGELTDHFDPKTKTVNLSQSVYNATSVMPCSMIRAMRRFVLEVRWFRWQISDPRFPGR